MTGLRLSDRLSTRQRRDRVFRFIREYTEEHAYPPTMREISDAVGFGSSSVYLAIQDLVKRGQLYVMPQKIRRYVIPGTEDRRQLW